MKTVLSVLCCLVVLSCTLVNAKRPNILLIVADDLGFNEFGFQNSTKGLTTPVIDGLAQSGVILHNYRVQPICSPTRSALMTGRYPIHLGTNANVIFWDTPWGISLDETFVGENLKDAGYNTAMFGKWHLGMQSPAYTPGFRGFDEESGFLQGCGSYYNHEAALCGYGGWSTYAGYDWNTNNTIDPSANQTYSATLIANLAEDFLQRQTGSDKPWFLYLPFQNIHEPFQADQKYIDMCTFDEPAGTNLTTICGMINELDAKVGQVLTALKASGEYDNTVLIVTSDNGAPPQGGHVVGNYTQYRNWPLRGWKTQLWEGGVRVPAFVHSPLLEKPGRVSHELFHITDWLPTIVGLAGGNTSRNKPLDGFDIWDSISTGSPSPRTEVLYNINPLCDAGQAGKPKAAISVGDMKLLCTCYDADNYTCTGPKYLFNLTADPTETNNLVDAMPAVVSRLEARLEVHQRSAVPPMQWTPPYQGPDYYCADCPLGKISQPYSAWRPWLSNPKNPNQPNLVASE